MRAKVLATWLGVMASVALAAAAEAGPTLGPAYAVSARTSPFAGCTRDDVKGQEKALDAVNYPNSEIEPWVEVNPRDGANLIAGWQQDRWSDGGARGLVSAASFDGGRTWTIVPVPKITKCSGGPWTRATDPWIAFSPDGAAYFFSLGFDNAPPTGGDGPNAMLVSRSTDGGRSWGDPVTLIKDTDPRFFNDKNAITADPKDSRYVYAVWDRLEDLDQGSDADEGAIGRPSLGQLAQLSGNIMQAKRGPRLGRSGTAALAARAYPGDPLPPLFKGPTWFARTTDGGRTWQKARKIYDPGTNNQTLGNLIQVLPDGTVVNFLTEIKNFTTEAYQVTLRLQRSTDHGATFLPARNGIAITERFAFGVYTPDELIPVRDGLDLFDVATDPRNGTLYAVFQDYRFRSFQFEGFTLGDEVAFAMSTDGGLTWSRVIRINQTPSNRANRFRQQAFLPSIAVAGDGTLVATYYDFRNDDDSGELADYWAVICNPKTADCSRREGWTKELRLTRRSFDYYNAPYAGGLFLGDYMGLAGKGQTVQALYGIADRFDESSLFVRAIGLP
ncbi:MAG: sialidase family protein [Geminicoccaceae bacterium]